MRLSCILPQHAQRCEVERCKLHAVVYFTSNRATAFTAVWSSFSNSLPPVTVYRCRRAEVWPSAPIEVCLQYCTYSAVVHRCFIKIAHVANASLSKMRKFGKSEVVRKVRVSERVAFRSALCIHWMAAKNTAFSRRSETRDELLV